MYFVEYFVGVGVDDVEWFVCVFGVDV